MRLHASRAGNFIVVVPPLHVGQDRRRHGVAYVRLMCSSGTGEPGTPRALAESKEP
jgi:hypothetical protein